MSYRKFLVSFFATASLLTPFAINAEQVEPVAIDDIIVAPASGQQAVVAGLMFNSTVVGHDTETATIQVTARNDGGELVSTEVAAALMLSPEVSPMARMVPMPREIAQHTIALTLVPNETFSKTITVNLPKAVSQQLKLSAKRRPKAQGNSDIAAMINAAPSSPSFFASVRALPTKASPTAIAALPPAPPQPIAAGPDIAQMRWAQPPPPMQTSNRIARK